MRDIQYSAQFVQMAQTLCYDLARAEKAKDGKKKWWSPLYWSMLSFDSPMREHTGHCTIRSNGTNTVLRPGESREGEGRKKIGVIA